MAATRTTTDRLADEHRATREELVDLAAVGWGVRPDTVDSGQVEEGKAGESHGRLSRRLRRTSVHPVLGLRWPIPASFLLVSVLNRRIGARKGRLCYNDCYRIVHFRGSGVRSRYKD